MPFSFILAQPKPGFCRRETQNILIFSRILECSVKDFSGLGYIRNQYFTFTGKGEKRENRRREFSDLILIFRFMGVY